MLTLAEAEAGGEADAVLEVRLPRAELLPARRRTRSSSPTVVKPYLANKKDKTFLDHWLLGDDADAATCSRGSTAG